MSKDPRKTKYVIYQAIGYISGILAIITFITALEGKPDYDQYAIGAMFFALSLTFQSMASSQAADFKFDEIYKKLSLASHRN